MTYPSDKPHNIKRRLVYCEECQMGWHTEEPNPKCEKCFGPAITVVKSVVSDELVNRIS